MPLSQDEKANIAMGDKICDEKISEEASSRIKKDMLIDAKINKLQEQINNLSSSKLYTKVLPDPKTVTKATETASSSSIAAEIQSLKAAIKDLADEIDRLKQINSTQEQNSNEALDDAGKRAGDALSGGVDILAKVNKYKDYQFTIDLMNSNLNVNELDEFGNVMMNFPEIWPRDQDTVVYMDETDENNNNLNYQVEKLEGEKYGIDNPYVVSYHLYFQINRDENYNWYTDDILNVSHSNHLGPGFYYSTEIKENTNDPYSESINSDLSITKYYNDSGKLLTSVLGFYPQIDVYKYKYLARDRLKQILPKNDSTLESKIDDIDFPKNNPASGYKISRSLKETVYFNEGSPYKVLYTDEVKLFYVDDNNETQLLFSRVKTKEWNKKGTTIPLRTKKLTTLFEEFFANENTIAY